MTRWHLLIDPIGRSGAENMALDYALVGAAQRGAAFLRLYCWDPPCLSFGRNEPATRRYDRGVIQARALDTVRRPTGGRAVWHADEVTYAVAAPVMLLGTLRESYVAIHVVLATALRHLGVRSRLAPCGGPPARAPGAGACFAASTGGEVIVDDRKVVGSAQMQEGEAFLQHGSILLTDAQELVAEVSFGHARRPSSMGLAEHLGRPVGFREVCAAVSIEAVRHWPGDWSVATEPPAPVALDRFRDPGWTWRR